MEGSDLGTTEAPYEAYSKMHQLHQEEATGDQVWSSKSKVLCMPSPPLVGTLFIRPIIIHFSSMQRLILIVALWLFFMGKASRTPNHEKTLEQSLTESCKLFS